MMKKLLLSLLLLPFLAFGADLRYTGTFSGPQPQPATGTILRSNATSWLPTTATYPDTCTSTNMMFGSSTNVISCTPFLTLTGGILFQLGADNPGGDMTINVSHSGTSSGASRAKFLASNGGAGGGDALITWTLTGLQSWSAGADISAANAWKLSASTALGTNDVITATTAGVVDIPGSLTVAGTAVGGAPGGGSVTLTSGNIATASTTLVDLTGATLTFTTGANPVTCGFSTSFDNGTLGAVTYFNLMVDAALQLGTAGIQISETVISNYILAAFTFRTTAALSAGSHTIKVQWKVSGGTATAYANSANALNFWCTEVK